MKKGLMSVCCSIIFVLGMAAVATTDTRASSATPIVDGSYLTYDTESVGNATQLTRGEDLLNGYSKIVRISPGTIYAGGTTLAVHTVAKVQLSIIVERAAEEDTEWSFVDGWHVEKLDAERVASNRRMTVEGSYYYRVRCIHSAGEDMSSSFTDGIYIEKP